MQTESETNTLRAVENANGWSLIDDSNQRWWPADEVQATIQASDDPAAEILRQYNADAPGDWVC